MQQNYQDAMAIVRHYGKPDLFITMTCNPKWPEITACLKRWETPEERPDIVARVFNLKLKEMIADLEKNNIFGRVNGLVHVVEFQKRGLPHAHILLILHPSDKPHPDTYDQYVCAEIPDKDTCPTLFECVKSHMVHGPCGDDGSECPCMKDPKCPGVCSKGYRKEFCAETRTHAEGYPVYRRRNTGRTMPHWKRLLDNRDVVPYNPYLLLKYNCHINVEICSGVASVKYLYKYVYKGPDHATMEIRRARGMSSEEPLPEDRDEVSDFLDTRYLGPCEAAWRLFGFGLHDEKPGICRLAVHEPDKQVTNCIIKYLTSNF